MKAIFWGLCKLIVHIYVQSYQKTKKIEVFTEVQITSME